MRAILYEDLVERLRSSGQFQRVMRTGEVSDSMTNLLTLNLRIEKFTNGNPETERMLYEAGEKFYVNCQHQGAAVPNLLGYIRQVFESGSE